MITVTVMKNKQTNKKPRWKYLKIWVGMLRGDSPGGSLMVGSFPDTILKTTGRTWVLLKIALRLGDWHAFM